MPYDAEGRFYSAKHLFDDRDRLHAELTQSYEIEAMKLEMIRLRRAQQEELRLLIAAREEMQVQMQALKAAQTEQKQLGSGEGKPKRWYRRKDK